MNTICLMKDRSLIRCNFSAKFDVFVDEKNDQLSTLCWLPNLHKIPYKSQLFFFLLRVLLPSCVYLDFLPMIKTMLLNKVKR